MATETDAARDRVLAARAALGDEIDALEASARAAVDIPAKVRASPAKAAAIAGSAGFVVLGGPKRIFGAARRAVFGPTAALPKQMLPTRSRRPSRSWATTATRFVVHRTRLRRVCQGGREGPRDRLPCCRQRSRSRSSVAPAEPPPSGSSGPTRMASRRASPKSAGGQRMRSTSDGADPEMPSSVAGDEEAERGGA